MTERDRSPTLADRQPTTWAFSQVAGLFHGRGKLLTVFFVSSVGRSVASVAVLFLIQRFLSGSLNRSEGRGFLVSFVAKALGEGAILWSLAICLLVVQIAGSVFNYVNYVAQQHVVKVVELGTMEVMIRHLLGLSVPFFDSQSHGDIIETILADVGHLRIMVRSVFNILFEGVLAIGLVLTVIRISPTLAVLALVVVPLAVLPLYFIAKRTFTRSLHVRHSGYAISDIILQVLRGIRVIKVFQAEDAQAHESVEKGRIFHDALIGRIQVERLASVLMESIAGTLVVVVIIFGGGRVAASELEWAGLLAFILAIRGLFGPINNMSTYYVDLQVTKPSVQRIAAFLAKQPEVVDRPNAMRLERPPVTIALEHVSFAYGKERVLDDISFEVRAGETIGIVSPSGGGKTTLLGILVRFYDPSSGAVRFDGRDLRDIRLADLYGMITLVTQEPFIFATTVRENIRYGRPSASDQEVEDAAQSAFIHDEIVAFPSGYNTIIGMGGRDVSGGQKQRISIARALLKNAPILLLDEATSALDSVSEAAVQQAVETLMRGRTSFVVAHRLSTLRNANRVLVLDRGACIAFGPHDDVVRDCNLYRRLWEAQRAAAPPATSRAERHQVA